eukprot:6216253-Alexandrium_andersonii.AAC.1
MSCGVSVSAVGLCPRASQPHHQTTIFVVNANAGTCASSRESGSGVVYDVSACFVAAERVARP